jgi:hypothetical protein
VPEAPIDKQGHSRLRPREIWLTGDGQLFPVTSYAVKSEEFLHFDFGRAARRADRGHDFGSNFCGNSVHCSLASGVGFQIFRLDGIRRNELIVSLLSDFNVIAAHGELEQGDHIVVHELGRYGPTR